MSWRWRPEAEDNFAKELGEVKDAIGEWHDWEELAGIATQVIQHKRCELLVRIHSTPGTEVRACSCQSQ